MTLQRVRTALLQTVIRCLFSLARSMMKDARRGLHSFIGFCISAIDSDMLAKHSPAQALAFAHQRLPSRGGFLIFLVNSCPLSCALAVAALTPAS
jgi:hypothetical protein